MNILKSTRSVEQIARRQAGVVSQLKRQNVTPRLDAIRTVVEGPIDAKVAEQQAEIDAYARSLQRHASKIGSLIVSPAVLPERLLRRVQDQDARPDIHSLLLFSPLHGVERAVADKAYNTVSLHKDADGLNEASREHATGFLPATALAVAGLMKANGIDAAAQGRLVTRIGDGLTVGKPLGRIHAEQGVDELVITSKHSKQELDQAVAKADIVIAAAGFPGLVTPDMLRAGQTVIGVGRRDIGASVYEAWRDRDLSITHEGGVGPLTSAFMHEHMLQSAQDNVLGSLATLELVEFGAELLEEDARHLVRA